MNIFINRNTFFFMNNVHEHVVHEHVHEQILLVHAPAVSGPFQEPHEGVPRRRGEERPPEGNTLLGHRELEILVVLRMNRDFMEYSASAHEHVHEYVHEQKIFMNKSVHEQTWS